MKINYKDADGRVIELEVTEEVGTFYLSSMEDEKSNDRRNGFTDEIRLRFVFFAGSGYLIRLLPNFERSQSYDK